ncbi:MAG: outer membrane beta-barrel protein [Alphaproteobacteria bacterium]|nr:outer membrane beta-barrel protein [Alphaproteobacteria bacterium]
MSKKWCLGCGLSFGLPIAKKKIDDIFQGSNHGIHLKHRFTLLVKPYLEYKFNNSWSVYGIAGFSRSYFELKNNKNKPYENYDTFRFTPGIGARNYISDKMSISAELLYSKKKRIHDTATQQGRMSIKTNQQSFSAKLCFRVAL